MFYLDVTHDAIYNCRIEMDGGGTLSGWGISAPHFAAGSIFRCNVQSPHASLSRKKLMVEEEL